MNKFYLCLLMAFCLGCSPAEKADAPNPDPMVSDPYLNSSLSRSDGKTPAEAEAGKNKSAGTKAQPAK